MSTTPSHYAASVSSTASSDSEDSDSGHSRPPPPYEVGYTFTAMAHTPPDPFGHGYINMYPSTTADWQELSQIEHCISCLSLLGTTHEVETRDLEITSLLRTGYDCGAQVVVVNGGMVAKIYDPLYYDAFDEYGRVCNTLELADGDYSREAAAYKQLQTCQKAVECTPGYFGSYTMQVNTPVGKQPLEAYHKRWVRLILIEWVRGKCMVDIHPGCLSKKWRTNVLKKALEAEAIIHRAGVMHRDLSPRNIIIPSSNYGNPSLQPKIFDFNVSTTDHPSQDKDSVDFKARSQVLYEKWRGKILSPLLRVWSDDLREFASRGWVSHQEDRVKEWMWKHLTDPEKYIPMVRSANDRLVPRPVHWDEVFAYDDTDDDDDDDDEGKDGASQASAGTDFQT
jgi:serine/threonine protein kinase